MVYNCADYGLMSLHGVTQVLEIGFELKATNSEGKHAVYMGLRRALKVVVH